MATGLLARIFDELFTRELVVIERLKKFNFESNLIKLLITNSSVNLKSLLVRRMRGEIN